MNNLEAQIMGFANVVMVFGLVCGIISIKLMSVVENAQIVVVKRVRTGNAHVQRRVTPTKIMFDISKRKLVFLRIGIWFFAKMSSLIFTVEEMYPEKFVETATLKVMKTVMVSNRIRHSTVRKSKDVARKIRGQKQSKNLGEPKV